MITINTPGAAYEYEYKGLSTDEKPTDCAANSLFLELDTGKFYYFDGESWNELGTGGGGGGDDVLYNGLVTFEDDDPYVAAHFDVDAVPADGDPVYLDLVSDGGEPQLHLSGTWAVEGEEAHANFEEPGSLDYLMVYEMGGKISCDISLTSPPWTPGEIMVTIQKNSHQLNTEEQQNVKIL